jgi:hypothetical protein
MYRMLHQRAPDGGEPQLRPLWSTPRMRERAAELLVLPGQSCQGLSEGEAKLSTQAKAAIAIRSSRGAAAPSAVVAQLVQSQPAAEHLLSPSLNEFGVAVKYVAPPPTSASI